MKYTNVHKLPEPYCRAVQIDDYDPGESDYTPSSLIRPPYMSKLTAMHDNEITVDVADRFFMLCGTLAHQLLERQERGDNSRAEIRIYTQVDRWVIGMQFDRLFFEKGLKILQDWKMTTTYKFQKDYNGNYPPAEDWEAQLNIGAFILRNGGWFVKDEKKQKFGPVKIDKLQIVGLLRDWHKSQAKRDQFYPQKPVVIRDIKFWSQNDVIRYVHERASAHDHAKSTNLGNVPPCTEEEMWSSPTTWAVMKTGRKIAIKAKLESHQSALDYIEKNKLPTAGKDAHYVEVRPGVRRRCEDYCDVADWCPAYQKFLEHNQPERVKEKRTAKEKYAEILEKKPEKKEEPESPKPKKKTTRTRKLTKEKKND